MPRTAMPEKPRRRKTSGGATATGEFAFQHSLAAWFACGVLAERAVSPRWELQQDAFYQFLRCETEQHVDDLMIGTSQGGLVLVQATTRLDRSDAVDSKLASA